MLLPPKVRARFWLTAFVFRLERFGNGVFGSMCCLVAGMTFEVLRRKLPFFSWSSCDS